MPRSTNRMEALFKGASLEVESIIREVCDRVLYGDGNGNDAVSPIVGGNGSGASPSTQVTASTTPLTKETQRLRAVALGIVGGVFSEVKPDAVKGGEKSELGNDAEYVRVDGKSKSG